MCLEEVSLPAVYTTDDVSNSQCFCQLLKFFKVGFELKNKLRDTPFIYLGIGIFSFAQPFDRSYPFFTKKKKEQQASKFPERLSCLSV